MNSLKIKFMLICIMLTSVISAQQKLEKVKKTINVENDVIIDLDLSHIEVQVETWDKSNMEIEAYIESDKLSNDDLKKALDGWNLEVNGSGDYVSIKSTGTFGSWAQSGLMFSDGESSSYLRALELEMANIPDLSDLKILTDIPELENLKFMDDMPEVPTVPELPELPDGIYNVNFDYEAYKRDGEKYMEQWSKEFEEKYGKKYKDQMQVWARAFAKIDWDKYEKDMEAWGENFGEKFEKNYAKKFEAWGEAYGKRMEEWGEKFGEEYAEKMEKRAEEMAARAENMQSILHEREAQLAERHAALANRQLGLRNTLENKDSKTIKTIKIKIPKKAKLKMNVRHGELKFSSVIYNLKADISHATLLAENIDGSDTSINVSYSPVSINNWNTGELLLNFVEKAEIKNAKSLMLTSNSSNIKLGALSGNSIINGSFGDLNVVKIDPNFKNLSIVLENSDAVINLPNVSYNLQYKGSRSKLQHPKNNDLRTSNFSTGEIGSERTIVLNSKFSNIVMQ